MNGEVMKSEGRWKERGKTGCEKEATQEYELGP